MPSLCYSHSEFNRSVRVPSEYPGVRLLISINTGAEGVSPSTGPPRTFYCVCWLLVGWFVCHTFVISFHLVYVDCTQMRALFLSESKKDIIYDSKSSSSILSRISTFCQ
jgi:hypothetical protein